MARHVITIPATLNQNAILPLIIAPFQSLDAECLDQQANINAIRPGKRNKANEFVMDEFLLLLEL